MSQLKKIIQLDIKPTLKKNLNLDKYIITKKKILIKRVRNIVIIIILFLGIAFVVKQFIFVGNPSSNSSNAKGISSNSKIFSNLKAYENNPVKKDTSTPTTKLQQPTSSNVQTPSLPTVQNIPITKPNYTTLPSPSIPTTSSVDLNIDPSAPSIESVTFNSTLNEFVLSVMNLSSYPISNISFKIGHTVAEYESSIYSTTYLSSITINADQTETLDLPAMLEYTSGWFHISIHKFTISNSNNALSIYSQNGKTLNISILNSSSNSLGSLTLNLNYSNSPIGASEDSTNYSCLISCTSIYINNTSNYQWVAISVNSANLTHQSSDLSNYIYIPSTNN